MKKLFISLLLFCTCCNLKAQTLPDSSFDWLPQEKGNDEEGLLQGFDWRNWQGKDWENHYKDQYQKYYDKSEASHLLSQAYQSAQEQGVQLPQRRGGVTFDPEKGKIYFETDNAYQQRLTEWANGLEDELSEEGLDLALELLYAELEPILEVLREQNSALLDNIIPKGRGLVVMDPIEKHMKKQQEGKKNFKYWVKLAAENVLQNLFRKNAEGKYELQRENIELLKEVGLIRFLKLCAMDWVVSQSYYLEQSDRLLSYTTQLSEVYQVKNPSVASAKSLYRQLHILDSETPLPDNYESYKLLKAYIQFQQVTVEEMVSQRKKMLGLLYRQLASRYRKYAEELSDKLQRQDYLKMSDADRTKTAEITNRYLQESIRLASRAEANLLSAAMGSDFQYKDEALSRYELYQRLNKIYSTK